MAGSFSGGLIYMVFGLLIIIFRKSLAKHVPLHGIVGAKPKGALGYSTAEERFGENSSLLVMGVGILILIGGLITVIIGLLK